VSVFAMIIAHWSLSIDQDIRLRYSRICAEKEQGTKMCKFVTVKID